jgi:hypothetical protein
MMVPGLKRLSKSHGTISLRKTLKWKYVQICFVLRCCCYVCPIHTPIPHTYSNHTRPLWAAPSIMQRAVFLLIQYLLRHHLRSVQISALLVHGNLNCISWSWEANTVLNSAHLREARV